MKPRREFTDVHGVADLTGLSEKSIRALIARRKIPFRKPPGTRRYLFSIDEVRNWVGGGDQVRLEDLED